MSIDLNVWLPGKPIQQGNTQSFPHPITDKIVTKHREGSTLAEYRANLVYAIAGTVEAANVADQLPLVGVPVHVAMTFGFPRPKSHYRGGKYAHLLRDDAPIYHIAKPDFDKLERAVLDAITASGVWHDDSQMADHGHGQKVYDSTNAGFTLLRISTLPVPVTTEVTA